MRFSFVTILFLISLFFHCSFVVSQTSSKSAPKSANVANGLKTQEIALVREMNSFARMNNFQRIFRAKHTKRFLFVYDTCDDYVDWIQATLEQVDYAFDAFAARFDFQLVKRNEPLVVVVMATREEYEAYPNTLKNSVGIYLRRSNRILLYDHTGMEAECCVRRFVKKEFGRGCIFEKAFRVKSRKFADVNIETIAHEATHLFSFNAGLFSHDGQAPKWLVEGMATTFETSDLQSPLGWRFRGAFPVNQKRLNRFLHYAQTRPNLEKIDDVILSDNFAKECDCDGYAAAWLCFYYCYRERPKELANYMKTISAKTKGTYSQEERIKDFEEHFGKIVDFRVKVGQFAKRLTFQ